MKKKIQINFENPVPEPKGIKEIYCIFARVNDSNQKLLPGWRAIFKGEKKYESTIVRAGKQHKIQAIMVKRGQSKKLSFTIEGPPLDIGSIVLDLRYCPLAYGQTEHGFIKKPMLGHLKKSLISVKIDRGKWETQENKVEKQLKLFEQDVKEYRREHAGEAPFWHDKKKLRRISKVLNNLIALRKASPDLFVSFEANSMYKRARDLLGFMVQAYKHEKPEDLAKLRGLSDEDIAEALEFLERMVSHWLHRNDQSKAA